MAEQADSPSSSESASSPGSPASPGSSSGEAGEETRSFGDVPPPPMPAVLRQPSEAERRFAKKSSPKAQAGSIKALGVGLEVLALFVGGAVVGWIVGAWLGDRDLGVVIGGGVGLVSGLIEVVRHGLALSKPASGGGATKREVD